MGGTVAAKETHMAGLAASWPHRKKIPAFNPWGRRGGGIKGGIRNEGGSASRDHCYAQIFQVKGLDIFNLNILNIYIVLILG